MLGIDYNNPALKKVDIAEFASYLKKHGWNQVDHPNKNIILFHGPADDSGEPLSLILPKNNSLIDAYMRLADAINILAEVQDKSPAKMLEEIKENTEAESRRIVENKAGNEKPAIPDPIAEAYFAKGFEFINKGEPGIAKRYFYQAVRIYPKFIGTLNNALMRLGNDGEWQRAITAMQLVLEINPNYEIARNNLAIAYMYAGDDKLKDDDIGLATEYYLTAINVNSTDPDIVNIGRNNLAAVYTLAGKREYEKGFNEFQQNKNLKNFHKQLSSSLTYMFRACAWKPDEATRSNVALAHTYLAEVFMLNNEPENIIYHLQQAMNSGLLSTELLLNYGIAQLALEKFEEAVWTFERALELNPDSNVRQLIIDHLTIAKQHSRFPELNSPANTIRDNQIDKTPITSSVLPFKNKTVNQFILIPPLDIPRYQYEPIAA